MLPLSSTNKACEQFASSMHTIGEDMFCPFNQLHSSAFDNASYTSWRHSVGLVLPLLSVSSVWELEALNFAFMLSGNNLNSLLYLVSNS